MKKYYTLLLGILLFFAFGCEEPEEEEPYISNQEILNANMTLINKYELEYWCRSQTQDNDFLLITASMVIGDTSRVSPVDPVTCKFIVQEAQGFDNMVDVWTYNPINMGRNNFYFWISDQDYNPGQIGGKFVVKFRNNQGDAIEIIVPHPIENVD